MEAYGWYAAGTRDEGQHSIWTFYEAVRFDGLAKSRINASSNGKGKSSDRHLYELVKAAQRKGTAENLSLVGISIVAWTCLRGEI